MAKMSLISEAHAKTLNAMLENASDEQREAFTMFGAQMYREGWMDWGGKFYVAGLIMGIGIVAVPLIIDAVAKHRDDKSISSAKEES